MNEYQTIYLENSKANRFWELEYSDSDRFYYTRQGEIGTLGRHSWELFEKRPQPHEQAQAMADKKRQKGYVDAPVPPIPTLAPAPEVLPGEPLSPEELTRFTKAFIEHPSEEQCTVWEKAMPKFLRENVYEGSGRLEYISGLRVLAQEFEVIAAWESPIMAKEVDRDPRGMVTEIRYYIEGMQVLRLRNQHIGHSEDPPIRPFFSEHETYYGFRWGKRKRIIEEARALLMGFPHFCAEFLTQVEGKANTRIKDRKIRTVASTSIEVLVENLMKGTGHLYRLAKSDKSSRLRVRLDDINYLELSLPHGSFIKRADDVLRTIDLIKELFDSLPMPIMLNAGGSHREWGTIKWHENYYHPEDPREMFWRERTLAYEAQTVLHRSTEPLDLEAMASWDIPGLSKEIQHRGKKIASIIYRLDGRRLLSLESHRYDYGLFSWLRDGAPENMPTTPEWRKLLEGLSDFYRAEQRDFEQQFRDTQWAAKIAAIMESKGYQWTLNLAPPEFAQLSMQAPKRRVLTLLLPYEQIDAHYETLDSTIERIVETLRASKLTLWIVRSNWREREWIKG
ncbi:MAG: hypothetical protein CSA97_04870 [Bacteroidetes bacterium]|nr:MAG: hypothetical protein CSA97_04870 [Bacteroidota bacterium]